MEQQIKEGESIYIAPVQRWIENGHIFLWLLKDSCWAGGWREGGIFMIFPTIAVALYILWRSRGHRPELFHNLAICIWIIANSVWMVSEFYEVDAEYKKYVVMIFATGILLLLVYYLFFFKKDRKKEKEAEIQMKSVL